MDENCVETPKETLSSKEALDFLNLLQDVVDSTVKSLSESKSASISDLQKNLKWV